MAMLPKLRDTAKRYTCELPSNGKKITFTAFTVREEKLLHLAKDAEPEEQIQAFRQVFQNCIETPLNFDELALFDTDWLWLKLRSKSIQEIVTVPFECQNPTEEGICGTIVEVPVNLDAVELKKNPENNKKISIEGQIGVVMKYPTFEIAQRLTKVMDNEKTSDITTLFEIICECVEMVYDGEIVTERERIAKEELMEFIESLSEVQFSKIIKFFDTLPVLRHEVKFRCPKCKHHADMVIEGSKSFLLSPSPTIL